MPSNHAPIQQILFGSPGTGKSYKIREIAQNELNIEFDSNSGTLTNTVKTVFHPEYTYADFMGKLLPLTQGNSIIYKFYPGHFLRILGMAYRGLVEENEEHYLLVIDELNRGNSAAIFGTVFQLLDREIDGWSSYEVDISDMEMIGLLDAMGLDPSIDSIGQMCVKQNGSSTPCLQFFQNKIQSLSENNDSSGSRIYSLLKEHRINIPSNLSIIATINTSDESIYYLDSAFKRRWDWKYIEAPKGYFYREDVPEPLKQVRLFDGEDDKEEWFYYIIGINEFIKSNSKTVRRIEDKQIGWWFIKPINNRVELEQVKNKIMFYLWDSVFSRDKRPLESFLSGDGKDEISLDLYSDFLDLTGTFMEKVYELGTADFIPF
jgi:5-methylcytosine-specific restriction enzyme B